MFLTWHVLHTVANSTQPNPNPNAWPTHGLAAAKTWVPLVLGMQTKWGEGAAEESTAKTNARPIRGRKSPQMGRVTNRP